MKSEDSNETSLIYLDNLIHNNPSFTCDEIIFKQPIRMHLVRIVKENLNPHQNLKHHLSITQPFPIKSFQLFALNLESQEDKFECVLEECQVNDSPDSDTLIPFSSVLLTKHLIIRGEYEKITIAIYGHVLSPEESSTLLKKESDIKSILKDINKENPTPLLTDEEEKLISKMKGEYYSNILNRSEQITNIKNAIELSNDSMELKSKIFEKMISIKEIYDKKVSTHSNVLCSQLKELSGFIDQLSNQIGISNESECSEFLNTNYSLWQNEQLIEICLNSLQGKINGISEATEGLSIIEAISFSKETVEEMLKRSILENILKWLNDHSSLSFILKVTRILSKLSVYKNVMDQLESTEMNEPFALLVKPSKKNKRDEKSSKHTKESYHNDKKEKEGEKINDKSKQKDNSEVNEDQKESKMIKDTNEKKEEKINKKRKFKASSSQVKEEYKVEIRTIIKLLYSLVASKQPFPISSNITFILKLSWINSSIQTFSNPYCLLNIHHFLMGLIHKENQNFSKISNLCGKIIVEYKILDIIINYLTSSENQEISILLICYNLFTSIIISFGGMNLIKSEPNIIKQLQGSSLLHSRIDDFLSPRHTFRHLSIDGWRLNKILEREDRFKRNEIKLAFKEEHSINSKSFKSWILQYIVKQPFIRKYEESKLSLVLSSQLSHFIKSYLVTDSKYFSNSARTVLAEKSFLENFEIDQHRVNFCDLSIEASLLNVINYKTFFGDEEIYKNLEISNKLLRLYTELSVYDYDGLAIHRSLPSIQSLIKAHKNNLDLIESTELRKTDKFISNQETLEKATSWIEAAIASDEKKYQKLINMLWWQLPMIHLEPVQESNSYEYFKSIFAQSMKLTSNPYYLCKLNEKVSPLIFGLNACRMICINIKTDLNLINFYISKGIIAYIRSNIANITHSLFILTFGNNEMHPDMSFTSIGTSEEYLLYLDKLFELFLIIYKFNYISTMKTLSDSQISKSIIQLLSICIYYYSGPNLLRSLCQDIIKKIIEIIFCITSNTKDDPIFLKTIIENLQNEPGCRIGIFRLLACYIHALILFSNFPMIEQTVNFVLKSKKSINESEPKEGLLNDKGQIIENSLQILFDSSDKNCIENTILFVRALIATNIKQVLTEISTKCIDTLKCFNSLGQKRSTTNEIINNEILQLEKCLFIISTLANTSIRPILIKNKLFDILIENISVNEDLIARSPSPLSNSLYEILFYCIKEYCKVPFYELESLQRQVEILPSINLIQNLLMKISQKLNQIKNLENFIESIERSKLLYKIYLSIIKVLIQHPIGISVVLFGEFCSITPSKAIPMINLKNFISLLITAKNTQVSKPVMEMIDSLIYSVIKILVSGTNFIKTCKQNSSEIYTKALLQMMTEIPVEKIKSPLSTFKSFFIESSLLNNIDKLSSYISRLESYFENCLHYQILEEQIEELPIPRDEDTIITENRNLTHQNVFGETISNMKMQMRELGNKNYILRKDLNYSSIQYYIQVYNNRKIFTEEEKFQYLQSILHAYIDYFSFIRINSFRNDSKLIHLFNNFARVEVLQLESSNTLLSILINKRKSREEVDKKRRARAKPIQTYKPQINPQTSRMPKVGDSNPSVRPLSTPVDQYSKLETYMIMNTSDKAEVAKPKEDFTKTIKTIPPPPQVSQKADKIAEALSLYHKLFKKEEIKPISDPKLLFKTEEKPNPLITIEKLNVPIQATREPDIFNEPPLHININPNLIAIANKPVIEIQKPIVTHQQIPFMHIPKLQPTVTNNEYLKQKIAEIEALQTRAKSDPRAEVLLKKILEEDPTLYSHVQGSTTK